MKTLILKCALVIMWLSSPQTSLAWGERGHDLVTRVAVKQLRVMSSGGEALTRPFELRDHMLSHLSNAPDFHWRARYMSKEERDLNYPTHFIGMETAYPGKRSVSEVDTSIESLYLAAEKADEEDAAQIGTAPWRVLQLYRMMVSALKEAKAADSRDAMIAATNQALLAAGLMSHFVGDLANPHHATENYNGQLTGNTGLHAYFEDAVVRALPFSLDNEIETTAGMDILLSTLLKGFEETESKAILSDPEKLIFALAFNSYSKVDALHATDDQFSIVSRSTSAAVPAIRKSPHSSMDAFRPLIVERLALGASVLARLWILAWEEAEKPNMSFFHSYRYFALPDFIPPDYLR